MASQFQHAWQRGTPVTMSAQSPRGYAHLPTRLNERHTLIDGFQCCSKSLFSILSSVRLSLVDTHHDITLKRQQFITDSFAIAYMCQTTITIASEQVAH